MKFLITQFYILLGRTMLISASQASVSDRIQYFIDAVIKTAPVAYILSMFTFWVPGNELFSQFISYILLINAGVGAVYHYKNGTFRFNLFIWRNIGMACIVVVGYTVLEMFRHTAGDNFAGDIFKILIQTSTLIYPASKIFKNFYILSKGKFPPEFLMSRLYDFEKNGDLEQFFKTKIDKK